MDHTNEHLKCVKCGVVVEQREKYYADRVGLPACCEKCCDDVIIELQAGASMWPSGWYGHAWKSSGSDKWRYDEWKPKE